MIEEIEKEIKKIDLAIEMLPHIINEAVEEQEDKVIQLNVKQQLQGQDAKGKKLGKYKKSTKAARRRKALQVAFIDLEDTGHYHSNFALIYEIDHIEVVSPGVSYAHWLDDRWEDLFGLTQTNLDKLSKWIDKPVHTKLKAIMK